MANRPGKKRKYDDQELDVERSMYTSFVTAANAVSQLYAQGVQQQRRAASAASRATLEKVLNFVLRDYPNSEMVPKAVLLQYLQYEYENIDTQDRASQPAAPPMLPVFGAQQLPGAANSDASEQHKVRQQQSGSLLSPARRGSFMQQGMDEAAGEANNSMETGPAAAIFMAPPAYIANPNMHYGQQQ